MRRAIARKRDGAELPAAFWHDCIAATVAEHVDEAQLAALLMACVLRGLSADETLALTEAFIASGVSLPVLDGAVDKHSSGGVGDSVSLVVVPWVAACGVPVAKLSGRALGHTGGTLDKLEAVPGVETAVPLERFRAIVAGVGCAIAAQTAEIVPADKRIYALRDRTATVPQAGLIAASIVSKKIAGGAAAIAYDIKAGSGAFMPDAGAAAALAHEIVALTERFGRRAVALVTDMNEPLGPAIGTGLETIEARNLLSGRPPDARLIAVCRLIAGAMLRAAGFAGDVAAALDGALASGAAYDRCEQMLAALGAHPGAFAALRPHALRANVAAARDGYLVAVDPARLGERARLLTEGFGPTAGIIVHVRTGEVVAANMPLATVYGDPAAAAQIADCFVVADAPPAARPLLYARVDGAASIAHA